MSKKIITINFFLRFIYKHFKLSMEMEMEMEMGMEMEMLWTKMVHKMKMLSKQMN